MLFPCHSAIRRHKPGGWQLMHSVPEQAKDSPTSLSSTCRSAASQCGGGTTVQASSPDEEALVAGASLLGFTLSARSHDKVLLIFPTALSPNSRPLLPYLHIPRGR